LRRQKPKAESAASSVHGSAGVWSADAAPHPSADIHASTAREERGFGDSTLRHVFRRYRPAMAGKDMRILAILLLVISVVPGRANEADHLGDHILNCLPLRVSVVDIHLKATFEATLDKAGKVQSISVVS
jgi:hypothetical protein